MKTRYTFLNYIAKMTFWGVLSILGITYLTVVIVHALHGYILLGMIIGLYYFSIPRAIISIAMIPIVALIVSFFTKIFFVNPNKEKLVFKVITLIIVSITSFSFNYIIWDIDTSTMSALFPTEYPPLINLALLHAIPTMIILPLVHYFALPHMFGTIQKRKEK